MIRNEDDLGRGLEALLSLDARLAPVAERAGPLPRRTGIPGMPGLVSVMVAQQVSRSSAAAIFDRLDAIVDLSDAPSILALTDAQFRQAGLSRAKERALLAIASAVITGTLDLGRVARADAGDAVRELTAIPGIGPWTAESYLLFSLGHEDIFPAGDLALQIAAAHGLGLEARPGDKALRAIAAFWTPHRSIAARLLWAYYAAITRRDAAPAAPQPRLGDGRAGDPDQAGESPQSTASHGFTKPT